MPFPKLIHVDDTRHRLFISRPESIKGTAFSPCCMSPDDVDYEMSFNKSRHRLEICGMNQESFEYFIEKYGAEYRYLSFFKCQLISDFSPLGKLKHLEHVELYWNIRADRLWDMSENENLKSVRIRDAKRMTQDLNLFKTSPTIKYISICGSMFNNTPLPSFDCFAEIKTLKKLFLYSIKPQDPSISFLDTLPSLEEFNFDAGMLTTEEIAKIVAYYPHLRGSALCAYNKCDAIMNDVRVCGFRKPSLDLPKDKKRLDKYIAEFDALVEKYTRK